MKSEGMAIERYLRRPLPNRRDLVAVLFRQRRVILAMFALAVIAVLASGAWLPKYQSHMKIVVRRQRSDAIVSPSATEPQQFDDQVSESDLNTEVELLNSEDLLRDVVLKTGLAGNLNSLSEHAREKKIARATGQLGKDLTIEAVHKANVISVYYKTRDPQKAAQVLNTLKDDYLEKHMAARHSSGESKFFEQEAQRYKQDLDATQQKLAKFTSETHVVSAEVERDGALRQANEFDTAASQAETAVRETKHRVDALQQQLTNTPERIQTVVRTSANEQLFQQLKSTLLNLELKRTELLTKYEPTYRLVQEVDKQIADTKSSIAAEEAKPDQDVTMDQNPTYLTLKTELARAQADLEGLQARALAARAAADSYQKKAQQLDQDQLVQEGLIRDAKTQEANYLLYDHKGEEARISDALDQRGILNVALAEQPLVPVLPTRSRMNFGILMLVMAGTFGLTAGFVVDFMDQSFRTPKEVSNYLGTPVLAALPRRTV